MQPEKELREEREGRWACGGPGLPQEGVLGVLGAQAWLCSEDPATPWHRIPCPSSAPRKERWEAAGPHGTSPSPALRPLTRGAEILVGSCSGGQQGDRRSQGSCRKEKMLWSHPPGRLGLLWVPQALSFSEP